MHDFILNISDFPTVLFSLLLGVSMLYWMTVFIGIIDIDVLDLDGALDGAMDGALDGAMDGAMDGALDGAMDGTLDGAMDGAADGAIDGAAESGGEGVGTIIAGLLSVLRLRSAPMTVVISIFALFGWLISGLSMFYAGAIAKHFLVKILILIVSGIFSLLITSFLIRPLSPIFETKEARGHLDSIGSTCRITTGKVSTSFGQAELHDGEAGLIIQVRCEQENTLQRNDEVLILSFDEKKEVYFVIPMNDLLEE